MYKIQTLNNISVRGLERFARDRYELASEIPSPHAIMLRSFNMHDMDIPASVLAVGRAGAGVNNIPVDKLSARGAPVFNAPGANANAVKELVIAGMLMAARNLLPAWDFARRAEGDDASIDKTVEKGKKDYAGFEIAGRTLGVIGLGAIGRLVANTAIDLDMKVVGFDPGLTVQGAWKLSSAVAQAHSVDELFSRVDFISIHVPLTDGTRKLVNTERLRLMRKGGVVLNFARGGIVDDVAVCKSIEAGHLYAYVCDFPSNALKNNSRVIALPHLGASTEEAEDNCAVMVADQLRDYLENGNIVNAVNFPEVAMPRSEGFRVAIANRNVPNMVGQISTKLATAGCNIIDMLNKSKGDLAYTLVDVNQPLNETLLKDLRGIDGVLAVRVC
ncbi:MAG: phosphoglycerate dehydrogenase [Pseudomonadota bacterium]